MKIYADCADLKTMVSLVHKVQGFTTNPTLMRQAKVTDYEGFARMALREIPLPISFEVIADTFPEMEAQAHKIQSWGEHAVVKIPVTNTKGQSSLELVGKLLKAGISVNITAIMTREQIYDLSSLQRKPLILSVFAGRIADTGRQPEIVVEEAVLQFPYPAEVLWASAREIYNLRQAQLVPCSIVTLSPELIRKLSLIGKALEDYSLETVIQFYDDAQKAGYTL